MIRSIGLVCWSVVVAGLAARDCRAGLLYVADTSADTIYRYDDAGHRSVFATEATGSSPRGIAIDKDGFVYVANFAASNIEKFSPTGQDLGVFASAGLSSPETLVFDAKGNLYVTSLNNQSLVEYSPAGAPLGAVAGIARPVGLAIGGSGTIYVANGSQIEERDPSGNLLRVFAAGLSNVNGIALDASGNLYAANSGAGTIRKFAADGTNLGDIVTGLSIAYSVAIDGAGDIDVVSFGTHSVHRYTPTGGDLGVIDSGLVGPTFSVYQAVPEPSSLALGAIGGAIGLAVASRRRRDGARISAP